MGVKNSKSLEEFKKEMNAQKKNMQQKTDFLKAFQRNTKGKYFSFVKNKFSLNEEVFSIVEDYNEKTKYVPFELDTEDIIFTLKQRNNREEKLFVKIKIKDSKYKDKDVLVFPIQEMTEKNIAEQLISEIDNFIVSFVKRKIGRNFFYTPTDCEELAENMLIKNKSTLTRENISVRKIGYSPVKNTIIYSVVLYSTPYRTTQDYVAVVNTDLLKDMDYTISYNSTDSVVTKNIPLEQVKPSYITLVTVENVTLEELEPLANNLFKPVYTETHKNKSVSVNEFEHEQVSIMNELNNITKNYPIKYIETVVKEKKNGITYILFLLTILPKLSVSFTVEEDNGKYEMRYSIRESFVKLYSEKTHINEISIPSIIEVFDLSLQKSTWYLENR